MKYLDIIIYLEISFWKSRVDLCRVCKWICGKIKWTKDWVLLTDAVWIFIKNKVHPLFPNAGIRRKTVFFHSLALHSVLLSSEPSLSFCFWCFYGTLTSYTSQDQGNDDPFKSSSCLNLFVRLGSKLLARNCFLHGSFGFSEWMNDAFI